MVITLSSLRKERHLDVKTSSRPQGEIFPLQQRHLDARRDLAVIITNPTFTDFLNEYSKFLKSSSNLGDFSRKGWNDDVGWWAATNYTVSTKVFSTLLNMTKPKKVRQKVTKVT